MRAVVWNHRYNVSVENVPDPILLNPRDAIIKVTSTCICGSDLHLYDGVIPGMIKGDILGHDPMAQDRIMMESQTSGVRPMRDDRR